MHAITATVDSIFYTILRSSVHLVMSYIYPETTRETPTAVRKQYTQGVHQKEQKVAHINTEKIPLTRGMVMYANAQKVPVFLNPTIEFDAKVTDIPFGAMLIAGEPKGRFYPVNWHDYSGWVLKEDIAESGTETHPKFVIGETNEVDTRNTALVRALINDEFGLHQSEFPLQAGEYVLYRLWRKGTSIPWTSERPRTPGRWHTLLKGQVGVHIGIKPETGAILECVLEGEIGHVAYVDAVFADESISISEVNNPDSGVYVERQLSKEEWIELRPVFIEFE